VGIQAASAVQAVLEGAAGGVMEHPFWMLVPWAVFAFAAGVKFWKITKAFRKGDPGRVSSTDQFRQKLERIWAETP
jgi:hypothetical protein